MIVVDASVLATALADDGPSGDLARLRLRDEVLTAPEVINLEIASALRGQAQAGKMPVRRAVQALHDLSELPLERVSHRGLVTRCWELRANVTTYDAAYVALAELLDVTLVTGDARLSRARGPRCDIEVLTG